MRTSIFLALCVISLLLHASNGDFLPGMVKANFEGSHFIVEGLDESDEDARTIKDWFDIYLDLDTDIATNAIGYSMSIHEELYTQPIPKQTTVAWKGYMRMEGGTTYEFKGCGNEFVTVKIDGSRVLGFSRSMEAQENCWWLDYADILRIDDNEIEYDNGWDTLSLECQEWTGSYTPQTTGWHSIEIRIGNGYGTGVHDLTQYYGVLWKVATDSKWRAIDALDENGEVRFSVGASGSRPLGVRAIGTKPVIVSSKIRQTDPTIIDVSYYVASLSDTVNVRALAFEDGERSFWKVVRPETFVNDPDGNPTAQNIGDGIAANVEHKLAWKVDSDWATDLAKVKVEILTSDMGQLPLDWVKIPGVNGVPDIEVSYNSQTDVNLLNALFWYFASGETDLTVENGYLKNSNGITLVSRTSLSDEFAAIKYVADKMGLEMFGYTSLYHYAVGALRKYFPYSWHALCRKGMTQVASSRNVGEKAYCVIDISGGTSAASYPVTYLDSYPIAGWGDEYKTTKILLRRIEPGTVLLGNTKPVTLTKPFYMGVFEVTQKQYQLVTGDNPSWDVGDMRPVEAVSWNDMRGNNWPNVTTVDPSSFAGRLQAKTGLNFDLPTESQWEYACRAGTTSSLNNGGSNDNDLKLLGRYPGNRTDGRGGYSGHTVVGSYSPNAWGLYDMHGNVWEWCLDWCTRIDSDPATDFIGGASGAYRVLRGGAFTTDFSFDRLDSYDRGDQRGGRGFRLSWTLVNN